MIDGMYDLALRVSDTDILVVIGLLEPGVQVVYCKVRGVRLMSVERRTEQNREPAESPSDRWGGQAVPCPRNRKRFLLPSAENLSVYGWQAVGAAKP